MHIRHKKLMFYVNARNRNFLLSFLYCFFSLSAYIDPKILLLMEMREAVEARYAKQNAKRLSRSKELKSSKQN